MKHLILAIMPRLPFSGLAHTTNNDSVKAQQLNEVVVEAQMQNRLRRFCILSGWQSEEILSEGCSTQRPYMSIILQINKKGTGCLSR